MSAMNRTHNIRNPYQGSRTKTLCVCSAGLLRSPTLAFVLGNQPYNRNTRAVGYNSEYALIPLEVIHMVWADEIVCADDSSYERVIDMLVNSSAIASKAKIYNLEIPDIHSAFSPELIKEINENLERLVYK